MAMCTTDILLKTGTVIFLILFLLTIGVAIAWVKYQDKKNGVVDPPRKPSAWKEDLQVIGTVALAVALVFGVIWGLGWISCHLGFTVPN
jgi:hypothetical protein